jgi:hypothetical protein
MSYTVEREIYSAPTIERKTMRKLEDWLGVQFESSSGKTPEFMAFARMFRARIKKEAARFQLEVVAWNTGHFYCSGFVKNKITGKFAYFSVSDVRHFPGEWADNILVRTAQHIKDYTGGANGSADLKSIGWKLEGLTK